MGFAAESNFLSLLGHLNGFAQDFLAHLAQLSDFSPKQLDNYSRNFLSHFGQLNGLDV